MCILMRASCLFLAPWLLLTHADRTLAAPAVSAVRISQVYGGGGAPGAQHTHDYVVLYNNGGSPVDLSNWSLQTGIGVSWQLTMLGGTLQPYSYLLVQFASSGSFGAALPMPDVISTVNLGTFSGKVALVDHQTLLTACPTTAQVVDLVGYGSADCFETVAAAGLTNSLAAHRKGDGCIDSDNNNVDMASASPSPRNSSSPQHGCMPALATVQAPCDEAAFNAALAIVQANSQGGTLTFDCPAQFAILFSNQKTINRHVIIQGSQQGTLSGTNVTRLFNVTEGQLTVRNLTLTNGNSNNQPGGAIFVAATAAFRGENVTIQRSSSGSSSGSALFASGTGAIALENAVVQLNTTSRFGAINSSGPLSLANSKRPPPEAVALNDAPRRCLLRLN